MRSDGAIIDSEITKEEFIATIKRFEKTHFEANSLFDKLYELIGDCDKIFEFCSRNFDEGVQQLSKRVNDVSLKDDGWDIIDWYIYDTNWGRENTHAKINGKEYDVNCPDVLWDVIVEVKNHA